MNLDIENWKQFKLGKVLSIKNGSGITKAEISQYEGDFPAVQSGESNNGILGYIDLDYCKEMPYLQIRYARNDEEKRILEIGIKNQRQIISMQNSVVTDDAEDDLNE